MNEPRLVCFVDKLDSDYVSRVFEGMRSALGPEGWTLKPVACGALRWDERMDTLHEEAHSGENTAAAFVHFHLTGEQSSFFQDARMPLGYVGGVLKGADCVVDDGFGNAYRGTKHLLELGHRRVALMMGDRQVAEALHREEGYRKAVIEIVGSVQEDLIAEVRPALVRSGLEAALSLLGRPDRPSAVFCAAGDLTAGGVYEAAEALKLRIPRELSVLGYDDLPAAAGMTPALSTLRQPLERMGAELALRLMKASAEGSGHKARTTVFQCDLISRGSCGPPQA
jgi:DNA-binding LacI/PurR family transcriptional regulator